MAPFRNRLSREGRRSLDNANRTSSEWKGDSDQYIMTFPIHPLSSMQAPFEESMLDATNQTGFVPYQDKGKNIKLRQHLLCKEAEAPELDWNYTYNCHWRSHSKGKFHPLLKTIAQIAFGVHLLHQHLEKSVADVADILLKHVNELDTFLQRANEDIESSLQDMLFRRKCLKVPMEHVNEFDRLLDDRMYRAQLLDGNIQIERTITRMSTVVNDYLIDMSTFRDANHELNQYLSDLGDAWIDENDDVGRIYTAMCGNTAGWAQFLQSLVAKSEKLGVVLVQVSSYCNEIEKRCGAASRRSLIASRSSSRTSSSRNSNSRDAARSFRNFAEHNKPLPMPPKEPPPFMSSTPSTADSGRASHDPFSSDFSANNHPQRAGTTKAVLESEANGAFVREEFANGTLAPPEIRTPDMTAEDSSSDSLLYSHATSDDEAGESEQEDSSHAGGDELAVPDHGKRPEPPTHSDSDTSGTIVPKKDTLKDTAGDTSPPLTGKDSAYSSVSGGSFASPTAAHAPHPRSASAQSSYTRPQFGLFPSSTPSTPKHSISGRHGAMSPALMSPSTPDYPVQRSHTSLDYHAPSSRRLLKKSSLSSLKRLFSKRKPGPVDTIAE